MFLLVLLLQWQNFLIFELKKKNLSNSFFKKVLFKNDNQGKSRVATISPHQQIQNFPIYFQFFSPTSSLLEKKCYCFFKFYLTKLFSQILFEKKLTYSNVEVSISVLIVESCKNISCFLLNQILTHKIFFCSHRPKKGHFFKNH